MKNTWYTIKGIEQQDLASSNISQQRQLTAMYLARALFLLLSNMQCLNLAAPGVTGIQELPHKAECQ
jgi:hypothetical protein